MSDEESIFPAVYLELLCLVNYFDLVPYVNIILWRFFVQMFHFT